MKVNLEFYQAAKDVMKARIEEFEEDLKEFKTVSDSVTVENNFGLSTGMALNTISNNIYTYSSSKLSTILEDITAIVENYMTKMDEEDVL